MKRERLNYLQRYSMNLRDMKGSVLIEGLIYHRCMGGSQIIMPERHH